MSESKSDDKLPEEMAKRLIKSIENVEREEAEELLGKDPKPQGESGDSKEAA